MTDNSYQTQSCDSGGRVGRNFWVDMPHVVANVFVDRDMAPALQIRGMHDVVDLNCLSKLAKRWKLVFRSLHARESIKVGEF